MATASVQLDPQSRSPDDGAQALSLLPDSEPVAWLAPNPQLSSSTRIASQFLFSLSSEYATQCPLKQLLVSNFDPEQIWQQIDLQSIPLLASARRHVARLERNIETVVLFRQDPEIHNESKLSPESTLRKQGKGDSEINEFETEEEVSTAEVNESESEEDKRSSEISESESEEGEANVEREKDDEEGDRERYSVKHAVEDEFFKLKDMEKFLDEAEAQRSPVISLDAGETEDEEEEDDDDEDDIEEDADDTRIDDGDKRLEGSIKDEEEGWKYNDFFGDKSKRKMEGEHLTTHEKQLAKVRNRIEQLEKANLESDMWTMQGEVSASKRPKNSALEVELDFEHNIRPPPVITEEVTASIEDLIRKRIADNNFDDVQRKLPVSSSAPKETIELDETKSKKGLAEVYEADYLQSTGLASAPISQADEMRKEVTQLFKSLCVKLDALSHFHFTPKPVIEDMAIRADVPALAMEEVAPSMVSDAQLLAPEEVFTGQGVLKAEAELSREDRRRRRARKKEKTKAMKSRMESKKMPGDAMNQPDGVQESLGQRKIQRSDFVKSTKVFEQLDQTKKSGKKHVQSQDTPAPVFKL